MEFSDKASINGPLENKSRPILFYGDDCTGATDALAQYVRYGLRVTLVFRRPDCETLLHLIEDYDVVGVAGTSRSMAVAEMRDELGALFSSISDTGLPWIIQYKTCSTFDSAPDRGSIGAACDLAVEFLGGQRIPVVAAQPELGRFTVFGNHFASDGDGKIYRLDRHPVMSTHPATPMVEADLQVHLSRQTRIPTVSVPLPMFGQYEPAMRTEKKDDRAQLMIFDALTDEDLGRIGLWACGYAYTDKSVSFMVGSGGLSGALGSASTGLPVSRQQLPFWRSQAAPTLVLSGSCSATSRRQVELAREVGWESVPLDADDVVSPKRRGPLIGRCVSALTVGKSVIVDSATGPTSPRINQLDPRQLGDLYASVVTECLDATPVRRIVLSGGDTSSWTLRQLPITTASLVGTLDPGVYVLRAGHSSVGNLELVLKGGQMGSPDLFVRFASGNGE